MRATYSALTDGMHHLFSRHGFSFMSASRSPTAALRQGLVRGEADQCAGQQLQRPVRPAGRGRGAEAPRPRPLHRAGASFRGATGPRRFDERARQAVFDEMLLGPIHRRGADPASCRNPFVGENGRRLRGRAVPRLIWRAARVPPRVSALQVVPFFERHRHAIAYVHGYLGSHCRSRVQSSGPTLHGEARPRIWPSSTPTHYSTGSRRPKPTSNGSFRSLPPRSTA